MIKMTASQQTLPRMGLGMAALGRPGYINLDRSAILGDARTVDMMQEQANQVLDTLFQSSKQSNLELPWVDCARSYGLSEKMVGEYFRANNVSPGDVYVSSKWGYTYVADWKVNLEEGAPHEVKDHSPENFLKQVKESAEYLGDYINLYQVHSATFESGILTDTKAHQALHDCRKQKGWKLGLSVSSPNQDQVIREACKLRIENGDTPLFDSVQCTFNVLEQRPGPALNEARKAGMDIIIKEGLANGRALQHHSLLKYAQQLNCEADQLALACILAQPFEPRVLSGAVTSEQLQSNLKAMGIAEKLHADATLLQQIMDSCIMDSEAYWKERSALAWN